MKKPIKRPVKNPALPAVVSQESPRHAARVAKYQAHYDNVGEALLGAVLRALATSDATYAVNSHLVSRFGLNDDAGIDIDEVRSIYISILKLEVVEILTRHSRLSKHSKQVLVDRIIAKAHPRRDGVPSSSTSPRLTRDDRIQDIESVIQRELKRSFPPRGLKTAPLQGITK